MTILSRISDRIFEVVGEASFAAMTRAEGELKRRIHQRGESANGNKLISRAKKTRGRYSFQYAKKRERAGRTINIKNLEFRGDLRRAYGVGTNNNDVVIGFFYRRARLIASGQEQQTGQPIFELSDEENRRVLEVFANRLNSGIRRIARRR